MDKRRPKTAKKRKSGRSTLSERILELLEKAKENTLTVRDFTKKLSIKRTKTYFVKGGLDDWGVYASQFYKTLRDLEIKGKIRIIPKRRPGRVDFETAVILITAPLAGMSEIKPIIDHLKDRDKIVHRHAAIGFHEVSLRKLIIITPEISKVLRNVLSDRIYNETWYYILEGLYSTLVTAMGRGDVGIVERIREDFLDISIKIASDSSAEPVCRAAAIKLLGKLDVKEALEPIFFVIAKDEEETYKKLLESLINSLCFLYPKFGIEIDAELYRLLKEKDTQKRADFIISNLRSRLGTVMGGVPTEF